MGSCHTDVLFCEDDLRSAPDFEGDFLSVRWVFEGILSGVYLWNFLERFECGVLRMDLNVEFLKKEFTCRI
jgi:hypothetical protein